MRIITEFNLWKDFSQSENKVCDNISYYSVGQLFNVIHLSVVRLSLAKGFFVDFMGLCNAPYTSTWSVI